MNSPNKRAPYDGPIDCGQTAIWWGETLQQAEKLRATLTRAALEAAKLEQMCRDNGIKCEDGMEASLTCTTADLGLDGLIASIDAEIRDFEDR